MLDQQDVAKKPKKYLKTRKHLSKLEHTQNNCRNFTFQVSRHSYKNLYWKNERKLFLLPRAKYLPFQEDRNKHTF